MDFADRLEARAKAREAAAEQRRAERVAKVARDGLTRLPTVEEMAEQLTNPDPELLTMMAEARAGLEEIAALDQETDS